MSVRRVILPLRPSMIAAILLVFVMDERAPLTALAPFNFETFATSPINLPMKKC